MFIFSLKRAKEKYISVLVLLTVAFATLLGTFIIKFTEAAYMESNTEPLKGIIVLDAGHGGEDSGAIGKNGVLEKDLNLIFSNIIGQMLEEEGFVVVYTRLEDKLLYKEEENIKGFRKISDLKNRCAIANSYEDAIFISVHMNSFGQEKYSGMQVYFSPGDEESSALGLSVQNKVRELVQKDNRRKIKSGDGVYVLENTNCRAVLIECGFLSNSEECKKLCKKEYQERRIRSRK